MKLRSHSMNILFWSIISAAFIGPGTVTTAAKAGAQDGLGLLWALAFSTLACLLLQEACARLTLVSGIHLGQAIRVQFQGKWFLGALLVAVIGAVAGGAAAYEMGNILGAVIGVQLVSTKAAPLLILLIAISAALLLSVPSLKFVSRVLGLLVVLMGMGFALAAAIVAPPLEGVLNGVFVPQLPHPGSSETLVLALIGTTIVPYNFFLGSGITDRRQSLFDMRLGLGVAILLGGLFSMAVLIVGTAISDTFSFDLLARALDQRIGGGGTYLLGFGLFAAGFTSAVTAPLASALTLRSLFGHKKPKLWEPTGLYFRISWLVILVIGTGFALANVKPVPAIILAQALNGLLLPFVSVFLYLVINNATIMGKTGGNGPILNALTLIVIFITLVLGLNKALTYLVPSTDLKMNIVWSISTVATLALAWTSRPGRTRA